MSDDTIVNLPNDEDSVIRFPAYEKIPYAQLFYNPNGDSAPGFGNDYYEAARVIIERIVQGRTLADREGIPALFLCRHYLELALKGVVFHSRWLETERKNVPSGESVGWPFGHSLSSLWSEIKKQFPVKTSQNLWSALDIGFVETYVTDFDKIDPDGERFRYRIERKSVPRNPLKPLSVSWPSLLRAIKHVHDVLDAMDTYLIETYGENEDWEGEMNF